MITTRNHARKILRKHRDKICAEALIKLNSEEESNIYYTVEFITDKLATAAYRGETSVRITVNLLERQDIGLHDFLNSINILEDLGYIVETNPDFYLIKI